MIRHDWPAAATWLRVWSNLAIARRHDRSHFSMGSAIVAGLPLVAHQAVEPKARGCRINLAGKHHGKIAGGGNARSLHAQINVDQNADREHNHSDSSPAQFRNVVGDGRQ